MSEFVDGWAGFLGIIPPLPEKIRCFLHPL